MSLPNNDPSLPSEAAPIFADTDAGRGDHLRANNQKIWQNMQYLDNGENIEDASTATPIDADQLGFWQVAGAIIKKVTFADFFLWLIGKIYALAGKTTPADADRLLITDSAESNVGKSLTLANLFLWIVSKVAALSSKATPVDADSVLLIDSEASNVGKRLTWANIKTAIFGSINGLTSKPTPVGADVIAIGDSAASFAGKKVDLTGLFAQFSPITAPVAWAPTFTGFGVVTGINARSWRVGAELFFEITWTCGTPTGTEARVSLGFNGVDGSVTTASKYPTLQALGVLVASGGFGAASLYTLVEASKTYIVFGGQSGSSNGLSKVLGTAFTGSTTLSAKGSVRIHGW